MGHFLDSDQPLIVRDIAKAVREDWRIKPEAPLYILAIEAMLTIEEDPLEEAMLLYADAESMGIRLPAPVHTKLMLAHLTAFEESSRDSPEIHEVATADAAEASAPGED